MDAIVVLTTAPDIRGASRIARLLVRKKLAACVSLKEGFISVYSWKGKIERQKEVQLIIKTSRKKFLPLKKAIIENHPYEVPEILSLPVLQGSELYLRWLKDALNE